MLGDALDALRQPAQVLLPASATQDEIENAVVRLNDDPSCTGFIVQLPLPAHIDTHRVLQLIRPDKDADGLQVRRILSG